MADKECTIYIVDVGQSTGEKRHGREISDLDWSMQYVWDKIATAVHTARKTLYNGVLALRSDKTNHDGPEEEEYNNLAVLKEPAQILMPDIRSLSEAIKPSRTNDGDAISAIIVAIQMITQFCGTKKFKKNIILVTNGDGSVDGESMDKIASKIKEEGIHLIILVVDMDDLEYGFKEEDKKEAKEKNEATFKTFTDLAGGDIGTLKQATDELKIPRVRQPRSMPTFKGKLCLGNSEVFDSAMEIGVERYPKVMIAQAKSARNIAIVDSSPPQQGDIEGDQTNGDMSLVHQSGMYEVKDDSLPDGKRDVKREDLSKGYAYGRSVVHVEPMDEECLKMDTNSGLHIMGFIPREKVEPYLEMTRTSAIIAEKTNDLAQMALSSLIHTLYELETCAIARLVTHNMKPPLIVALTPCIEPDFEGLIDVELPFAEDFRQHRFAPLDRALTISGKALTEHRLLPTNQLKDAMSAYVDSLDLSEADRDEDGQKTDFLKLEDSYAPKLHRINESIQYRAIHPQSPVPPPNEVLLRFSQPPEKVMQRAQSCLEQVREKADIKKVPPKSLSRRNHRGKKAKEAPRSGLDLSALLDERSAANKHRISPDNAIPEFKQILVNTEDVETIRQSVSQLGEIVRTWIKDSMGDANYGRAVEGIRTMREECTELEEPGMFNDFLRDLRTTLFKGELGGDRREMWWQLRCNHLGLIGKKNDPRSDVTEEQAREFMIPNRTKT